MGVHFLPLLFVTLFGTQCYAAVLNRSPVFSTAPAFAWSSNKALQQADDTSLSKVIYEDIDTTALINNLWSALSRSPAVASNQQQASADTLAVFVGNQVTFLLLCTCLKDSSQQPPGLYERLTNIVAMQLHLERLSSKKDQPALQPLQSSIRTAGSALSIPALSSQGAGLANEVLSALEQKTPALHASAACTDPAAELEQPVELVQKLASQSGPAPKAIVVCAPAHAKWTLESEIAYLDSLSQAVKAAHPHNIMAYISDGAVKERASTSRSLLQSIELPAEVSGLQLPSYAASLSVPDTYLCDDKCFTQVRVIEVFILFVTLITALLSGVCMLNVLGTPTKFETAKDVRSSHE